MLELLCFINNFYFMSEKINHQLERQAPGKQQLENIATNFFSQNSFRDHFVKFESQKILDNSKSNLKSLELDVSKKFYSIEKGDTLIKIAKKHQTSIKEILALNPQIKNPNLIKIWQKIFLPSSANISVENAETPENVEKAENVENPVENAENPVETSVENSVENSENTENPVENPENNEKPKKNFPENGIYLSSWDIKNAWGFADWNEKSFDFNDAKIIPINKFHPNKVVLIQEKLAEFWLKIEDVNIYEDKDTFGNSEYVITQKNDDIVAKKLEDFKKMQVNTKQATEDFYKTVYGSDKSNSQDEFITASK